MDAIARCDSTDTGNFALRRARLGESYTEPGRLYEVCRRRGMTFVTISDLTATGLGELLRDATRSELVA